MKKYMLIIIMVFLLSLFFTFNRLNIENIIKDIVLYPYNKTSDNELDKSIDYLKEELSNKDKELEELKSMLELNETLSTYKIINATIVSRSIESFFKEVTINKGTKDGIKKDMAVVTNDGLIGKIIKANKNNSVVKLITSADMYNMLSIQINIGNKYVYGILKDYDLNTNSFIIEGIDENVEIKEGSMVSTTGLSNIYPSGLVIGEVVRIQKDNFDLAYILKVKPSVDFDDFHYVAVLDRGKND